MGAYGKWNSVFRRYRRWVETGVFDAMLDDVHIAAYFKPNGLRQS